MATGLAACVGTGFGESAEQLREDLVGEQLSILHGCAPVPTLEPLENGARYRFFWLDNKPVISVGADEWPPRSIRRVPAEAPEVREERDIRAYCLMQVDVDDQQRIQAIDLEGRDPRGLRSEQECMVQVGRCLSSKGRITPRPRSPDLVRAGPDYARGLRSRPSVH